MNPNLEKQLVEKYPKLFGMYGLPPEQSCMAFGMEHGDGWYWLLENLCNCIQTHIDNNPHLEIVQPVFLQVKEKYASLRIYHGGGDEYIDGKISFAEHLSNHICEVCGTINNVETRERGTWIKTLCEECNKLWN